MGNDIAPGINLVDGQWVHDADLNALVGNATILQTAISARSLMSALTSGAEFLVNDGGTLRKCTTQQIVQATAPPAGSMMDYAGATEPLGWVFCYGQALSRTTYAALFAAIGTAYGAGDGSTTFNVPDFRSRVAVGRDDMGGTAANLITSAISGFDAKVLGNKGGSESHTLKAAEGPVNLSAHVHSIPGHTHPGVDHLHDMQSHVHSVPSHAHTYNEVRAGIPSGTQFALGSSGQYLVFGQTTGGTTGAFNTGGPSAGTTGAADRSLTTGANSAFNSSSNTAVNTDATTPHRNLQPVIITNKIIKT
jgi:microcystin-dependent protein